MLDVLKRRAGAADKAATVELLVQAAAAEPDAVPDDRQLRALAAFPAARGAGGAARGGAAEAEAALTALAALFATGTSARALRVARAEGAAAALDAGLRDADGRTATAAARALVYAIRTGDAQRALLRGAPGLFQAAAARLAACAPPTAAAEAGVRSAGVVVGGAEVGSGVSGGGVSDGGSGGSEESTAALCNALLLVFTKLLSDCDPELSFGLLAPLAPALVALLSHADLGTAGKAACAATLLARLRAAATRPRVLGARRFFDLGGRGLLRGVRAQLAWARRELEAGRRGGEPHNGPAATALYAAALVNTPCLALLACEPKRLCAPSAGAWAAAAPTLVKEMERVARLLERHEAAAGAGGGRGSGSGGGGGGSWMHNFEEGDVIPEEAEPAMELKVAIRALQLIEAWVPEARRATEAARRSGAAGPGWGGGTCDGGGGGGPPPQQRRRCAACGRTRADGARLRRCRGCGALTGVMYCGAECAREHWVRRGHRRVCEPAARRLGNLRRDVGVIAGRAAAGWAGPPQQG